MQREKTNHSLGVVHVATSTARRETITNQVTQVLVNLYYLCTLYNQYNLFKSILSTTVVIWNDLAITQKLLLNI